MRGVEFEVAGRILTFAVVLGLSAGCHRAAPQLPETTERQRTVITAAMQTLRTSLNDGSCRSIYDEAGEVFRQLQPVQDWIDNCEHIRTKWGPWESFEASGWNTALGEQVTVNGTAVFATGRYAVLVGWSLTHEGARMWMFSLKGAGENIFVPPFQRHFDPPHIDPPPLKDRAPA